MTRRKPDLLAIQTAQDALYRSCTEVIGYQVQLGEQDAGTANKRIDTLFRESLEIAQSTADHGVSLYWALDGVNRAMQKQAHQLHTRLMRRKGTTP